MPVFLNSNPSSNHRRPSAQSPQREPSSASWEQSRDHLAIGLINNMPDAALLATERQFLALLDEASGGIPICISLYSMPGIPRGKMGAGHVGNFYSSTDNLGATRLDGLIVTGREPLAPRLEDEPYWGSFTQIVDWASDNTYSTIWSCLAAHAAVLYQDGIRRIKSERKHSGIFDCTKMSRHPLIAGTPTSFRLPHSRWNGISENQLKDSGYSVLTRSEDVGVDTFVKQLKSMFVYFQGHPEYESDTLMLEYRRDVGRYLSGDAPAYPTLPQNYFDEKVTAALMQLQQEAGTRTRKGLFEEVCAVLDETQNRNAWHSTAVRIYKNWLDYICAQKTQQPLHEKLVAVQPAVEASASPIIATRDLFS
jgi:homoserine O-succinyltransferase/O-acetyltransferase